MNESEFYATDWLGVEWTDWGSLYPDGDHLPGFATDPGLYRVRHSDRSGLVYIGETGRSLRGRVRALARGTYADEMPYRDPHIAAPCLWAIQQEHGDRLEVSVTTPSFAEDKQSRKAFKDALIAMYRREARESPTANFGRIIDGYKQSSYRSGESRGGVLESGESEPNAEPGVGPLDWRRSDDVVAADWMGLNWSNPQMLEDADSSIPNNGRLHRLWRDGYVPSLGYIGQMRRTVNRRQKRHFATVKTSILAD